MNNMFGQIKPNRKERRKRTALRRKSTQQKTKGAFGLPVFYPVSEDGLTNHERVVRGRSEKGTK